MRMFLKMSIVAITLMLIPVVALATSNGLVRPAEAAPLSNHDGDPAEHEEESDELWFAQYVGIEGESEGDDPRAADPHDKWIDVLSIDWGSNKPGGGATGQSRRRGGVIVEDMRLTMEYEKSSVKLLEKLNMGEVIPKLEIEQTSNYGGSRATYLKYELTNVQVTSFEVSGAAEDGGPPTVTIANNFEEYKVTYTEYNSDGSTNGGNAETTWKVEKGEK